MSASASARRPRGKTSGHRWIRQPRRRKRGTPPDASPGLSAGGRGARFGWAACGARRGAGGSAFSGPGCPPCGPWWPERAGPDPSGSGSVGRRGRTRGPSRGAPRSPWPWPTRRAGRAVTQRRGGPRSTSRPRAHREPGKPRSFRAVSGPGVLFSSPSL